MTRTQTRLMTLAAALCLLAQHVSPAVANPPASPNNPASSSAFSAPAVGSGEGPTGKSPSKATTGAIPSSEEIAAAKASGKVWVNLDSGVYHKRGRWYGKTKNGKFMTPDEAKKAGYRPAKRE